MRRADVFREIFPSSVGKEKYEQFKYQILRPHYTLNRRIRDLLFHYYFIFYRYYRMILFVADELLSTAISARISSIGYVWRAWKTKENRNEIIKGFFLTNSEINRKIKVWIVQRSNFFAPLSVSILALFYKVIPYRGIFRASRCPKMSGKLA